MDPTFKGITTYAERTYIFTFYLEEMDPTFKGITTAILFLYMMGYASEEMDPTFKGITTNFLNACIQQLLQRRNGPDF